MVQSDVALGAEATRGRSGGARWLVVVLIALAILAAGWTALWFYAVHRAGAELDAAMAREAKRGRVWSCPDRAFAGFPLEIAMICRNPSFAGKSGGKPLTAQATALRAKVALYDPNRVVANIEGPLRVVADDKTDVKLSWAGATINLKGPMQFERASIELERPQVTIQHSGSESVGAAAASASIRMTALDRRSPKDSDQQIRLQVASLAAPMLDAVFGSSEPANVDATGIVSDVDAMTGSTLPERLEHWRVGGGRLKITDASLVKGSARLDLAGLLGLDDQHRPQGDLAVGMTGFEKLLHKAHVPVRAMSVGNLLGGLGLTSGNAALPDHGGRLPDMQLGLTFADGRVSLGPISLPAVLKPLY